MKRMAYLLVGLLTFWLLGAPAGADIVTIYNPTNTTDAAFSSFLDSLGRVDPYGGERFVAQGRIGLPGSGDYEIGLHGLPNFTNAGPIPGGSSQWNWVNGATVPFELSRSGEAVTFKMGAYAASLDDGSANLLAIRWRVAPNSSLVLTDLSWGGSSGIGGISSIEISGESSSVVGYWAFNNVEDDFVFTGNATLGWSGTMPTRSNLAFQIKGFEVSQPVPEPSTMFLLGGGFIGLLGLKRRFKK